MGNRPTKSDLLAALVNVEAAADELMEDIAVLRERIMLTPDDGSITVVRPNLRSRIRELFLTRH